MLIRYYPSIHCHSSPLIYVFMRVCVSSPIMSCVLCDVFNSRRRCSHYLSALFRFVAPFAWSTRCLSLASSRLVSFVWCSDDRARGDWSVRGFYFVVHLFVVSFRLESETVNEWFLHPCFFYFLRRCRLIFSFVSFDRSVWWSGWCLWWWFFCLFVSVRVLLNFFTSSLRFDMSHHSPGSRQRLVLARAQLKYLSTLTCPLLFLLRLHLPSLLDDCFRRHFQCLFLVSISSLRSSLSAAWFLSLY